MYIITAALAFTTCAMIALYLNEMEMRLYFAHESQLASDDKLEAENKRKEADKLLDRYRNEAFVGISFSTAAKASLGQSTIPVGMTIRFRAIFEEKMGGTVRLASPPDQPKHEPASFTLHQDLIESWSAKQVTAKREYFIIAQVIRDNQQQEHTIRLLHVSLFHEQ